MMATFLGTIEVQELPGGVRYFLPNLSRRDGVQKLLKEISIVAFLNIMYTLAIWYLIYADTFGRTSSSHAAICGALFFFAISMPFTNYFWFLVLRNTLVEFLGKRTEIEMFPPVLRRTADKGRTNKAVVYSIDQIDRIEVRTTSMLLMGNHSCIMCEIDKQHYPLVWRDDARSMMIDLAHDLGRRINRPVAVREPEYD